MEVFLLAAICAILVAVHPYQAGQVVGTVIVIGVALSAVIAFGVVLIVLLLALA